MDNDLQHAFSGFCHAYALTKGYKYDLSQSKAVFHGVAGKKPFLFILLRLYNKDGSETYTVITQDAFGDTVSLIGGLLDINYVSADELRQCLVFATKVLLAR